MDDATTKIDYDRETLAIICRRGEISLQIMADTLAIICAKHLLEASAKRDQASEPEEAGTAEPYHRSLVQLDLVRRSFRNAAKEHSAKLEAAMDTSLLRDRITELQTKLDGFREDVAGKTVRPIAAEELARTKNILKEKVDALYASRLDYLRLAGSLQLQERILKQKEEVSSGLQST